MNEDWKPDITTLRWVFANISESEMLESIQVYLNHEGISSESDLYWETVARGATEGTVYALIRRARLLGTSFDDSAVP